MIKLTLDAIGKFYKYDRYITLTRMYDSNWGGSRGWFVRYCSVYRSDRIK